jgi:hypothetical protein
VVVVVLEVVVAGDEVVVVAAPSSEPLQAAATRASAIRMREIRENRTRSDVSPITGLFI